MPELPEVETVRRGLDQLITGKTISTINHNNDKSFPNNQDSVDQFMIGAKVTQVKRRAKVLLIELSTNYTIMVHLKMTGQLVFVAEATNQTRNTKLEIRNKLERQKSLNEESFEFRVSNLEIPKSEELRFGAGHPNDSLVGSLPDRSTRVTLHFTDETKLYFNDQRRFGWVKLLPTGLVQDEPFMKKVGPEPLEPEFTSDVFTTRIKRRKGTSVKAAILDQTVLAGVGNIYADESLWAAKIHPASIVGSLKNAQLVQLQREIVDVMNLSIEKGGSTNKNYVDAEGKRGSYMEFANVFRREGQPCNRCGSIIEKSRVAGRGTHTCPSCQVAPAI